MAIRDLTVHLEIRSRFDGSLHTAALRLPRDRAADPLPLIYAPHPFGWTIDEDYHGGCTGLKAAGHAGWMDVASNLGVAVLQPAGHHRVVPNCSLGYEGTVLDVPQWIEAAGTSVRVDPDRVYACGLSMGGQESLLALGRHPGLFAAAFVFNPVVDVAAWQEDLTRTPIADLRAEGAARHIVEEVGGFPADVPERYRERSPLDLLLELGHVPLAIWWSTVDAVVPRQVECHGKRLYDALKGADAAAPVTEYEHSHRYGFGPSPTDEQRWAIHETAEYAFAARWLLLHRRTTDTRNPTPVEHREPVSTAPSTTRRP